MPLPAGCLGPLSTTSAPGTSIKEDIHGAESRKSRMLSRCRRIGMSWEIGPGLIYSCKKYALHLTTLSKRCGLAGIADRCINTGGGMPQFSWHFSGVYPILGFFLVAQLVVSGSNGRLIRQFRAFSLFRVDNAVNILSYWGDMYPSPVRPTHWRSISA